MAVAAADQRLAGDLFPRGHADGDLDFLGAVAHAAAAVRPQADGIDLDAVVRRPQAQLRRRCAHRAIRGARYSPGDADGAGDHDDPDQELAGNGAGNSLRLVGPGARGSPHPGAVDPCRPARAPRARSGLRRAGLVRPGGRPVVLADHARAAEFALAD